MLTVRPLRTSDHAQLAAIHQAQGFAYELPGLDRMLLSAVAEEHGEIHMAALLRPTTEAYLLVNPQIATSRKQKLGELIVLHRELRAPTLRKEISDWHCWLPPEIESRFGKLLLHLGWRKPLWPSYSYEVK